MLGYDLGEMKSIDGSALRYEVETKASEYAIRIGDVISATPIYKQLIRKLPSKHLLVYFRYVIKKEIYSVVRQGCIIQWYKRNGKTIPANEGIVKVPKIGIFPLLKTYWDIEDVPIKLINPFWYSIKRYTKKRVKKIIKKIVNFNWLGDLREKNAFSMQSGQKEVIACYYVQGIDSTKRNDLNWYLESKIDPGRILIYFDVHNTRVGKPIEKEIIQQIEKNGFKWIALKKYIIENQGSNYWQAPKVPRDLLIKKSSTQDVTEKWVEEVGNDLLEQVYYWNSFYNEFDVRIVYTIEENLPKTIAQAIAFDIRKKRQGIIIGMQRSELYSLHTHGIGFHPKHIFFIWNERAKYYLNPNYNEIEVSIISGYPYDVFKKRNISNLNSSQILKSKGVRFIIAFFDNGYKPNSPYSKNEMIKFYQSFLEWVIDDPAVGLVIKSKRPSNVENLFLIQPLLKKALESGRCIRLTDEWGRLPSDASFGADMAIGCGISSALIEAVIAGSKGVLYDMTHFKNHEFYQWGHESIIFEDLEKMIFTLKRYKENRNNEPKLGDWSPYLDKLDPFRDGRGGERMGVYMRWLLERFDKGAGRDEAIHYANDRYAERWGADKVIDMNSQVRGEYAESF